MYTDILIPTDGSEVAGKAVKHGVALAKRIGAKVTVLTVLQPFTRSPPTRRCSRTRQLSTEHVCSSMAEESLGTVAAAAQAAGVVCKTVQGRT
jgi:nucleotide-binding universal stress UspA family protein